MNKFHVTVVALLLAGAAVLGAVAVTRTTHLGAAAKQANDAAVAARTKQLTLYAAKLRQELKASEHFEDLMLLREVDTAGRVPGAAVGTVDEALDYLRELERENEEG